MSDTHSTRSKLVWAAAVLLAFLHHDVWWWSDRSLVLNFLPIGLFYHMLFSLAAAGLWALAVKFAWPAHIEEWASGPEATMPGTGARGAGDSRTGGAK